MATKRRRARRKTSANAVLSGKDWVAKFPTSRSVDDLEPTFQANVKKFLNALATAGATVVINATYRPKERAYLMHYAFRIARQGLSPLDVPVKAGVDIQWVHRTASGKVDLAASRNAAEEMVLGYDIAFKPALNSNHTLKLAIDMTISWSGDLKIADAAGKVVTIASPRTGQNSQLVKVGASYKVIKLISDPPHWSANGR
jgi:hypothetical protein